MDEQKIKSTLILNCELMEVHNHIIKRCDNMLTKNALVYKKDGKRLLAVSREALTRIFYLSYAYRMTKDTKYLKKAEVELNAVCTFENWNPTHFLDVGEMTMAVAIGYDWLYDVLQDSTKMNVRKAIVNYAFKTSKVEEYNWFLRTTNNWNQVCNAGLVYGAIAIFEDEKIESKEMIERALKTNLQSLAGYAPDGNYPEGCGYWGYGTSFEVMLIAALESALGSDNALSQSSGFLKSAEYMLYMNGPAQLRFNYSDCSSKQNPNLTMFWFAQKLKNPNLLFEEKKLLTNGQYSKNFEEDRLLPATLVFAKDIDFSNISPPTKKVWSGQGATPVVLVRTNWKNNEGEYLGVKGGSASTSHAHMDAGSFVYDSKGLRWAMDFGLQSYITLENKDVDLWNMKQNSQRWDIFRLSNLNHNTITINNKKHNVTGKALMVKTYDTNKDKGAKFDMSEIFEGEIKSEIRKVVLKDETYLQVEDEITTNDKEVVVRWTMVTPTTVKILNSGTIELSQKGKKKFLKVCSANPFELKIWKSDDPETEYDAKNPGTVMIGFEAKILPTQKVSFVITIKD